MKKIFDYIKLLFSPKKLLAGTTYSQEYRDYTTNVGKVRHKLKMTNNDIHYITIKGIANDDAIVNGKMYYGNHIAAKNMDVTFLQNKFILTDDKEWINQKYVLSYTLYEEGDHFVTVKKFK